MGGVPLYSDLLLHDVAYDEWALVDQEEGVLPTEYRTPPLWGVTHTAPYLHDGSASDLEEAIIKGHFGEAEAARPKPKLLFLMKFLLWFSMLYTGLFRQ